MKRDKARIWTDKELAKLEKRLNKIYSDAEDEIREKWDEYLEESTAEIDRLEAEHTEAKRRGDLKKAALVAGALIAAKKAFTVNNNKFKDIMADTARAITKVNIRAMAAANSKMPDIYEVNFNLIIGDVQKINKKAVAAGLQGAPINENMIKHLSKGGITLPPKKVITAKDIPWNMKRLNAEVLKGILNGESIPKIADRVQNVTASSRKAAIRTARTMVTQAENRGRYDSMREMEKLGAVYHKQWLATHDGRTRAWHLDMDGQEVPLDDVFIDGLGNELEYPADPSAEPATVYNCRCSMKEIMVGIRDINGNIIRI